MEAVYGGEFVSGKLQERLAEEKLEYILAILRRFGQVRHVLVAGSTREAMRHCIETQVAPRRKFEHHVSKLARALAVQGYIDYRVGAGAHIAGGDAERGRAHEQGKSPQPKNDGASAEKQAGDTISSPCRCSPRRAKS